MKKQRRLGVRILGVRVDFLAMKGALRWVEEQVKYNKVGQITTPNPEQVVLAQKDEEFREVLNKADLNICDGVGLSLAAKLLGKKAFRDRFSESLRFKLKGSRNRFSKSLQRDSISRIDHRVIGPSANIFSKDCFEPSRLSGVDLMLEMCRLAGKKKWKVFLLGGKNGVAEKTVETLHATSLPNVKISFDSGSVNIANETEKEKKEIISKINKFKPNLLFVAYGASWQEKWIAKNLPKLKVNVAMGVGGAFDYISGRVGRAPEFVRKIGLEWLWRLVREPWRIKRQFSLLKFVWMVGKERLL